MAKKLTDREIVDVGARLLIKRQNNKSSAVYIVDATRLAGKDETVRSKNETVLARAFGQKLWPGHVCLIRIDYGPEQRRKLKGKQTLLELLDQVLREEAIARDVQITNHTK